MPHDETNSSGSKQPGANSKTIQFSYIKSNHYRVIHADGMIGGAVHKARLVLSFFSERIPIPQVQTYELNADGSLGEEQITSRVVRSGVVREVEASVSLDLRTAKAVRDSLSERIASMEASIAERPATAETAPNGKPTAAAGPVKTNRD